MKTVLSVERVIAKKCGGIREITMSVILRNYNQLGTKC